MLSLLASWRLSFRSVRDEWGLTSSAKPPRALHGDWQTGAPPCELGRTPPPVAPANARWPWQIFEAFRSNVLDHPEVLAAMERARYRLIFTVAGTCFQQE